MARHTLIWLLVMCQDYTQSSSTDNLVHISSDKAVHRKLMTNQNGYSSFQFADKALSPPVDPKYGEPTQLPTPSQPIAEISITKTHHSLPGFAESFGSIWSTVDGIDQQGPSFIDKYPAYYKHQFGTKLPTYVRSGPSSPNRSAKPNSEMDSASLTDRPFNETVGDFDPPGTSQIACLTSYLSTRKYPSPAEKFLGLLATGVVKLNSSGELIISGRHVDVAERIVRVFRKSPGMALNKSVELCKYISQVAFPGPQNTPGTLVEDRIRGSDNIGSGRVVNTGAKDGGIVDQVRTHHRFTFNISTGVC
ncbi:hypothetical protein BJ085DRAFT_28249 [Dimargaris cristalligena]|uniref:Uncharacterized protein n=1 Tax=Dimargaris cristalligena TaxID=215637 RepID=A0A4P9ZLQ6_9FUNG|nr:hypothetical protein BJ085DRAFT_28249 [Dimargaris cristalligena]|eukprot:RKP34083.1 hypothetical protein BJ085DRAFT_28249 [Dimargaris cristalligena]